MYTHIWQPLLMCLKNKAQLIKINFYSIFVTLLQSSDGAVAGSDAGSPTPFYPSAVSPAAVTPTSPRTLHPSSPRAQGSICHQGPFPRSEGNIFQASYASAQHDTTRPLSQGEVNTFQTPSHPQQQQQQQQPLTLSERIKRTHPLWYLPNVHRTEACRLLFDKEQGVSVQSSSYVLLLWWNVS